MNATDDSAGMHRGTARDRVLAAARALCAEYGVSGTSLQMIADRLGVVKAAVYHQFHTKEEIVLALLQKPFARLESLVAEAEARGTRDSQLEVLLPGLVDVVLENPEAVALIQGDPSVARLVQTLGPYREIVGRLTDLLAGPDPDPTSRIASALFGAGLLLIGQAPLFTDIDADTMRRELPRIGRRILL